MSCMQILNFSDIRGQQFAGSVVTIGNFDGVHRGHIELFRLVNECGVRLGLPTVVVTFEPHPLAVLAPDAAPPLITTFDQKAALISATGIDYLVVIEFTPDFSLRSADSFVCDVLCHTLGMRHIIIGHDYSFGRARQGNFETLSRLSAACGFTLEDVEPVGDSGVIYSSSLARRMIAGGDMPGACQVLGRYHVIAGQVVHGREIGHKLGFPTANIETRNELIPVDGVYAVMVSLGDELFQGACNIGTNPTFNGKKRTIEVFLLDFARQLYGNEIALFFVQRLRDVQKFPDAGSLIQAIGQDVAAARTILGTAKKELIKPTQQELTHRSVM